MNEDELSVKDELQDSAAALELSTLLELSTELLERLCEELLERLSAEDDNSTAEDRASTDEDEGATAEDELATRSEELVTESFELSLTLLLDNFPLLELLRKDEDDTVFTKDEVPLTQLLDKTSLQELTTTAAEEPISAEEVTSSPILTSETLPSSPQAHNTATRQTPQRFFFIICQFIFIQQLNFRILPKCVSRVN